MDAYVYLAALLCTDCAVAKMACLEYTNMVMGGHGPRPGWQDTACYPQGPYSHGGGEADCPQHCGVCGVFLENPLTGDGTRYVSERLVDHARTGSGNKAVLEQWAKYYNACVFDPGSVLLEDLQFEYSLEDDDWGTCMSWWFTIAGELYTRNVTLPEEWKYKPGIHPVDPDDHNGALIAGAPTAVLFEFMKTIEADAKRLKEAGRDC
jgi:hypothetical protein